VELRRWEGYSSVMCTLLTAPIAGETIARSLIYPLLSIVFSNQSCLPDLLDTLSKRISDLSPKFGFRVNLYRVTSLVDLPIILVSELPSGVPCHEHAGSSTAFARNFGLTVLLIRYFMPVFGPGALNSVGISS
jgi:hypothetical protein